MSDHSQVAPRSDGEITRPSRFCVNCRHCERADFAFFCRAPQNAIPGSFDLVTGKPESAWRYKHCSAQRVSPSHGDNCSRDGLWFEAIEEQREAAE